MDAARLPYLVSSIPGTYSIPGSSFYYYVVRVRYLPDIPDYRRSGIAAVTYFRWC